MNSIIEALRVILGEPQFYVDGALNYNLLFEYFVGALIVLCVVCNVFRLVRCLFGGK